MIELATSWCDACNQLADWMSNDNDKVKKNRWWKEDYKKIKNMINSKELYYVTVLYEGMNKNLPNSQTVNNWFVKYPDEKIYIIGDTYKLLHRWVKPTGIPTAILLNDKMEIVKFSNRGINDSFDKLLSIIK